MRSSAESSIHTQPQGSKSSLRKRGNALALAQSRSSRCWTPSGPSAAPCSSSSVRPDADEKRRYVGLPEETIEAVNSLPRLDSCPYVFYSLRFLTRWAVCRKPLENAAKQAGVPDLQVKDLIRHYAISLAEGDAGMHDIQQALGHSSVGITEKHYAQFSPRHSARKILKLLKGGASSKKRSEVETKRKHGQRIKRSKE